MAQLASIGPSHVPVPPQNLDAEESVLGAMMLSPNAIDAVCEVVDTGDFYRQSHAAIFAAAKAMHARGEPVDAISVVDYLERQKAPAGKSFLEQVGGRTRIHELAALVPATANAPHYAKIVKKSAVLRGLIRAGGEISTLGWEQPGELDELLAEAEKCLARATMLTSGAEFRSLTGSMDVLWAQIEEAYRTGQPMMGALTGYPDLDAVLTGLHPGQFVLIAARPGMGKSTLAQNIAENFALRGDQAAFFALEMNERELQIRALSRAAQVDSQVLRTGRMTPDDFERARAGALKAKQMTEFYFEDNPALTPQQLRTSARRLHRQKGAKVLFVDYLQLMASDGRSQASRNEQISDISRALKVLARELNIPVVGLSQLNRDLEKREDKRPRLHDLRESGSLEQDADVVLFLYRDEMHNPDSPDLGICEVIVAKQRMGQMHKTVRLAYTARYSSFKSLARNASGLPPTERTDT